MPKRKSSEEGEARFEESLAELQGIVTQLESGASGLEVSLQHFERGIHLLRHCYQQLDSAEQRIELLVGMSAEGAPLTKPFDSTATAELKTGTAGRRASVPMPSPASPQSLEEADMAENENSSDHPPEATLF